MPDYTDCKSFATLLDEIDELQAANKWDQAERLCVIRRRFDDLHWDHAEMQLPV